MITFGARIEVEPGLHYPDGERANLPRRYSSVYWATQDRVNRLINDPVVRMVMRETSNDIVVKVQSRGRLPGNELALSIERPEQKVPDDLKPFCYTPRRIVNLGTRGLLDLRMLAAAQQRLNRHVVALSERLRLFDWEQQRLRKQNEGLGRVAGMDALKQQLRDEVLEPIQNPRRYQKYGRTGIPNGYLFFGPPGCGKTYLAQCLAEELKLPFLQLRMSDISSKYIHETTRKIGEFFEEAERKAPCLVFIDEMDAVMPDRRNLSGSTEHKSEEVSELLVRMEQSQKKGIVLIGATNFPQRLDEAGTRAGRLDKHIYIGPPDEPAREAALRQSMASCTYQEPGMDYAALARQTAGFAYSDLELLVAEAIRLSRGATEADDRPVSMHAFQRALLQVTPSVTDAVTRQYQGLQTRGTRGSTLSNPASKAAAIGFKLDKRQP